MSRWRSNLPTLIVALGHSASSRTRTDSLLHPLETLAIAAPGRGEFNQDGLFVRDSRLANVGEFGSNFRPRLRRGGVRPRFGI